MTLKEQIESVTQKTELSKEDILFLLSLNDSEDIRHLGQIAYRVKQDNVGKITYFRGLVEFSNICVKDCLY